MCDVHPLPMRKSYGPHLACVPSASRPLAVFGFLILVGGGVVETGRNRSRDWMCGIKNWVEENEDSVRKLRHCLNFLQLSFSYLSYLSSLS
jgi:hypothetical protein